MKKPAAMTVKKLTELYPDCVAQIQAAAIAVFAAVEITLKQIKKANKAKLIEIAGELNVEVDENDTKAVIAERVIDAFEAQTDNADNDNDEE